MPPESQNVAAVRRLLELNRSGQTEPDLSAAVQLWATDCSFESAMGAVEPKTYRGHDDLRLYMEEMASAWASWWMEIEEISEPRPGVVVAVFRAHLVGKDSGVPLDTQRAAVWQVIDGLIHRGRTFLTREEAMDAVG